MPPTEFDPAIRASKRPQTHALDRATTEIDKKKKTLIYAYLFPGTLLESTISMFKRNFWSQTCLLQTDGHKRMLS